MANQEPEASNTVAALVALMAENYEVAGVVDLATAADPRAALTAAAADLGPASLVIVAPNAAHGARRLAALAGETSPPDVLDRHSLLALVGAAGLRVRELRGTLEDPVVGAGEVARRVPPAVVEWVRGQTDALVREIVAVADVGVAAEQPALVPAVSEAEIRVADRYTTLAERDRRERREVLTVRDHIIGLEAAATTAEDRAYAADHRLHEARQKLTRLETKVERLRTRVRELEADAVESVNGADSPGGKAGRRRRGL